VGTSEAGSGGGEAGAEVDDGGARVAHADSHGAVVEPVAINPGGGETRETAPQLVYRGGSAKPDNLTPRPGIDKTGLSTFDTCEAATPPGGKAQVIDISQTIWSILSDAFGGILRSLQATMPEARMAIGHSHNEAFPFRTYAEYSIGEQVVDLSFDVQVKDSQVHASGDIAREHGLIVQDLMQADVGPEPCEELLIAHARDFALQSQRNAGLIARKLARVEMGPSE
jgi:hypothetical protein